MPRLKESIRSTKAGQATKKYYVETATNEKLLLRIADISQYDKKKKEFEVMKRLAASGVPVSQPVEFGICNNGQSVYSLFTWCLRRRGGDSFAQVAGNDAICTRRYSRPNPEENP